jgi:molybdate transport system ATP-binding protein
MHDNPHFGIVFFDSADKDQFIANLLDKKATDSFSFLNQKKGLLFSDLAIERIIEEEERFDRIIVTKAYNRKLQTFSSGEKKKHYLAYCKNQTIDYLILDNPLDHLDANSKENIIALLAEIAKTTMVIQTANRPSDILGFLENHQIIQHHKKPKILVNKNKLKKLNLLPEGYQRRDLENEILIAFKSVSVQYGNKKVLDSICWTIKKGEFWQLIGPNGSGKSTMLSLINGDNPKGYGQELYLFGCKKGSGESIWDIKKQIGYFNPAMTELFNGNQSLERMLLSGFFDSIGLYTEPTALQLKIAQEWIEIMQLTNFKQTPYYRLNTGQKRLVLIARAMIKKPSLLILDEPLEGLDEPTIALITTIINTLISQSKMAVLYVSHRFEPRMQPTAILELIPSEMGSKGEIK